MSTLTTGARALAGTLREEHRIYRSLIELAGHEQRAIVGGDVERLSALTEQKEQWLELLATLETERMTALTAIAAATGARVDALTVTSVAALLAPTDAKVLTGAGAALREEAIRLQRANERNAALLRASRDVVERWIGYLRALLNETLTYTAGGHPHGAAGGRVIDRSA